MSAVIGNMTSRLVTDHPYYPLEVEITSYLANEWSVPVLLGVSFGLCVTILFGTLAVVHKVHPGLHGAEKAAIWWFVLCKCCPSTWKTPPS